MQGGLVGTVSNTRNVHPRVSAGLHAPMHVDEPFVLNEPGKHAACGTKPVHQCNPVHHAAVMDLVWSCHFAASASGDRPYCSRYPTVPANTGPTGILRRTQLFVKSACGGPVSHRAIHGDGALCRVWIPMQKSMEDAPVTLLYVPLAQSAARNQRTRPHPTL